MKKFGLAGLVGSVIFNYLLGWPIPGVPSALLCTGGFAYATWRTADVAAG